MKKLIAALCFFACATARAQIIDFAYHLSSAAYPLNGGVAGSSGGGVTPYSGTPVLGDMIYFDGTNWVSLAKPADGDYAVRFTASIPSWTAAAGGAPADATYITQTANGTLSNEQALGSLATGFMKSTTTTGVVSTQATIALSDLATQAARTVVLNATSGSAAPTALAGGGALTSLVDTGSALEFETLPYDLTKWDIINTSFTNHGSSSGSPVNINQLTVIGTGASAGYVANTALIPDGNHPNIAEITTGTASTGGVTIGMGSSGSSTTGNGLKLTGGEVVDWLIYIPVASGGGTNAFRISAGFCNIVGNGACTDGAFITLDANSDTHWAVETIKAGSGTTGPTASTTVATYGATCGGGTDQCWHHLKVVVNSNATSIAFYVDGTELSSSPLATNIPVNVVAPMLKMVASAGCAAATTCVMDANTVYYRKPVTR